MDEDEMTVTVTCLNPKPMIAVLLEIIHALGSEEVQTTGGLQVDQWRDNDADYYRIRGDITLRVEKDG